MSCSLSVDRDSGNSLKRDNAAVGQVAVTSSVYVILLFHLSAKGAYIACRSKVPVNLTLAKEPGVVAEDCVAVRYVAFDHLFQGYLN